jgi:transcription initiation factor IIE alpha subunit
MSIVMGEDYTGPRRHVFIDDAPQYEPDICRETRRAIVDMIRDEKPSTVLGLLVERGEIAIEQIAYTLEMSLEEVRETVSMLEDERLCLRKTFDDPVIIKAFAQYTERNE